MARSVLIDGKKLREARDAACLTQTQLAEKINGMSDENIGRIERADPPEGMLTKNLPALAAALGKTLDWVKRELVLPAKPKKDQATVKIPGVVYRAAEQKAKALPKPISAAEWIAAAAEAVLRIEGWRPGELPPGEIMILPEPPSSALLGRDQSPAQPTPDDRPQSPQRRSR